MTIKFNFKHVPAIKSRRGSTYGSPYVSFDIKNKQVRLNAHAMTLLGTNKTRVHLLWDSEHSVVGLVVGGENLPGSYKISRPHNEASGQFTVGSLLKKHPEVRRLIKKLNRTWFPLVKVDYEIPDEYEGEPVYAVFLQ